MLTKNSKFAYYVHESEDGQPMTVEGTDATFSRVIEVTTAGWTPSTVDVWGVCTTCEQTVRVELHSHSHKCKLKEVEGCSWVSPEDVDHPQTDGLIPPETIGDWDSSLYLVGPTGSNHGLRTRRVNGVIVDRDGTEKEFSLIQSEKLTKLPEVRPNEPNAAWEAEVLPYSCSYCNRRFASRLYYSTFHNCAGWAAAKAMLALSKRKPQPETPVRTVVRREAASRENWYEADRNRVPSELGKLDWLNPRQD